MPESQYTEKSIEKLFDKMDDMSTRMARLETKTETLHGVMQDMQQDVRGISNNGCNKAVTHADHEARIRAIEGQSRLVTGMTGAGGVGIGAVIYAIWMYLSGSGR